MEARLGENNGNTEDLFKLLFMVQTIFDQYNMGDSSYHSELEEISVLIDDLISKMIQEKEARYFT